MGWRINESGDMMKYEEYLKKNEFSKSELLAHAWGSLVSDTPSEGMPTLPAPPFLMFDRIVEVSHKGNQGRIIAEQDVSLDHWYFQCHFRLDPVQPGCLGLDAIWQMIGFYISVRGAKGSGRALGAGEVEFMGQIRPHNRIVRYEVDIRRYFELPASGAGIAIGNGRVLADDELVYTVKDAKVGAFKNIRYANYPHKSENAVGGKMER